MTQYLAQESLALLLWRAFWLGIGIGAAYSLFGIRRAAFMQWRFPRLLSALLLHLEDFLICVAAGVLLSVLYFATTNGVLRLMAIPALGLGIGAWRCTAGRLITFCTDRILHLLAVGFRWLQRRLLFPIGRFWGRLAKGFFRLCAAWRDRRFYKRLARQSGRITRRYTRALLASAEAGRLPRPDLRGIGGRIQTNKRNNKQSKIKERSR